VTVQDLEIKNALNHPVVCTSCAGVIYQRLRVHDNLGGQRQRVQARR
jgi:hypothetical protein